MENLMIFEQFSLNDKKAKLVSGNRFKNLEKKLKKKETETPDELAAYIGRKKLGKKKIQELAARGK